MRITIVGTGYVGLVTGAGFADFGNQVLCVDVDHAKIEMLERGQLPFYEPGLDDLIARNVRERRLRFGLSLEEATRWGEAIFICVGTPQGEDGRADRQPRAQPVAPGRGWPSLPGVIRLRHGPAPIIGDRRQTARA